MGSQKDINLSVSKYLPFLGALVIFMQSLDGTILNTALSTIARDFGESPLEMQSIIVSYTLTVALLIPVSGWLTAKYGTKRVFISAIVLFTLGSLFCALSFSLNQLILSRIFQAFGGALMVPVVRLTLLYTYPKAQILKVINYITIPALIGPMLGPTVGGFLVEQLSWHWIFILNIPIGLAAIVMAKRIIPNFTSEVGRFDIMGWLYISIGLTAITLVIEKWNNPHFTLLGLFAMLVLGALSLAIYILHAKRKTYPLINLGIFSLVSLRVGVVGNLISRLGTGGMPLMIPLMLQVGFGYSAFHAGLMMIPQALANIFSRTLVLPIVRTYGYRTTLIFSTILTGLIIGNFFFITLATSYITVILLMVSLGAVTAIQSTAMNTITMADLNEETSSDENSLISVTQQLAVSLGISLASMLLLLFENKEFIQTNNQIDAFRYAFLVMGILTVLSSYTFTFLDSNAGTSITGKVMVDEDA